MIGNLQEATDELITVLKNKGSNSKIIISSYLNGGNPCKEKLCNLIIELQSTGADVIKFDVDVAYITDVAPIFHMLTHCQVLLIMPKNGSLFSFKSARISLSFKCEAVLVITLFCNAYN